MQNKDIALTLAKNLNLQLEMCENLELLADSLPHDVDEQNCLVVAKSILPVLKDAHDFEETVVFPALQTQSESKNQLATTLERLKFEHWEDESFAEELRVCLVDFVQNPDYIQVTSISYMLRGFFEGVRRHVAFEREHIMPLLSQH